MGMATQAEQHAAGSSRQQKAATCAARKYEERGDRNSGAAQARNRQEVRKMRACASNNLVALTVAVGVDRPELVWLRGHVQVPKQPFKPGRNRPSQPRGSSG
jgi:hypothetical protein